MFAVSIKTNYTTFLTSPNTHTQNVIYLIAPFWLSTAKQGLMLEGSHLAHPSPWTVDSYTNILFLSLDFVLLESIHFLSLYPANFLSLSKLVIDYSEQLLHSENHHPKGSPKEIVFAMVKMKAATEDVSSGKLLGEEIEESSSEEEEESEDEGVKTRS